MAADEQAGSREGGRATRRRNGMAPLIGACIALVPPLCLAALAARRGGRSAHSVEGLGTLARTIARGRYATPRAFTDPGNAQECIT